MHWYANDIQDFSLFDLATLSLITVKQKIKLYKDDICPCLTWGFRVLELPISWIECQLESKATKFLKKWLHAPQGAPLFAPGRQRTCLTSPV